MAAGDGAAKLAKMTLPGLTLFETGKGDLGLYHIRRLDQAAPNAERLVSRFWQRFFGSRFGLWDEAGAAAAWRDLADNGPQEAESLLSHLPAMGRQFKHGLKTGALLDESFWSQSPAVVRPLTGLAQMQLENGDYKRPAWAAVMAHLEGLIQACS